MPVLTRRPVFLYNAFSLEPYVNWCYNMNHLVCTSVGYPLSIMIITQAFKLDGDLMKILV